MNPTQESNIREGLALRLRHRTEQVGPIHVAGCERVHADCALLLVLEDLDRVRTERDVLRAECKAGRLVQLLNTTHTRAEWAKAIAATDAAGAMGEQ